MFFERFCEDKYVVHINTHPTFSDFLPEYVVHHRLERRWRVQHHKWFEQAPVRPKSCLPFVSLFNPDVIVPPTNIHF
ncbi:hypothetical protein AMATHDRAFT_165048 [Amanita thiersii Skay4041]|uniref:Uncharacterized protein n=1 Tax=Amanita thiersii Skay4041 TaxID=703135 RepID=A0A2A9NAZ8_9AGAR|nr:hypothetical protein AMATHDRAFT_165048 [Amanita thiersii Skay4041]